MKSTDKIIDYLKKTYQPESIIVYGSFADGSANLNSDFDALIIAGKEKLHDSSFVDALFLMYLFIRRISSCRSTTRLSLHRCGMGKSYWIKTEWVDG